MKLIRIILISLGLFAASNGFSASLSAICNYTNSELNCAVLYAPSDPRGLYTRGWLDVQNGQCSGMPIDNGAQAFGVYCKALDGSGRTWGGQSVPLCVKDGEFLIYGANRIDICNTEGGYMVNFNAAVIQNQTFYLNP